MIVWIQGIVATAIPWIIANALLPDQPLWAAISLVVPLLFAAFHARFAQAWLAPAAGIVSVLPVIPAWASAIAVIAVAALLLLRPPVAAHSHEPSVTAPGSSSLTAQLRTGLLVALSLVLVLSGIAMALVVLLQRQSENASFDASQAAAASAWSQLGSPSIDAALPSTGAATAPASPAASGPALVGAPEEIKAEAEPPVSPPFAKLRFLPRENGDTVVTDRTLYVGPDVSERGLKAGPGHYPTTSVPGAPGNIAIAGHRTGWGSPFADLDQLQSGDRVRIIDPDGTKHTYVVDSTRLVDPGEAWVLGPDPLGTGKPTLTLTTCDPPGVNTKRLIVFATLKKSVPTPRGTDS